MGSSLHQRIRTTAAEHPCRVAFSFLDSKLRAKHYTFRELLAAADAIGDELRRRSLDPTAPFGILLQTQEDQVLHYLGAQAAGLTPSILTPPNRKLNLTYYAETMQATLDTCGFSAIVTDVEAGGWSTTTLEPRTLKERTAGRPAEHAPVGAAALLQFSSGTTGTKRGVLVSDSAALAQLSAYARAIGLSASDRILSWLPLYHDMGFIACLHLPLVFGVPCVMIHPIDWVSSPGCYLQAATEYRATLGWNPNFAYAFMADRVRDDELQGVDLSSFRGLVNCSEPVTHESQERFHRRFSAHGLPPDVFWGCYAMAETTFAITHGRSIDPGYLDADGPTAAGVTALRRPLVSVGRPIEGVELRVVDACGDDAPDRALGELWVKSPFNFAGYYNNDAATADAFGGDWYKTGDVGYRVGTEFFVCARNKDLLIVGGVNLWPQDVEDLVSKIERIIPGRVACFAEFDSSLQTEKIIILAETDRPPSEHQSLIVGVRQRILAAFRISNFEVHLVEPAWLVKSSAGKMARRANHEKWAHMQATSAVEPAHAA